MPKYYKEHARGYDLDLEHEFIEIDGERYLLGSAGSIIMVCRTCGEEHFRDRISEHENCFQGHGRMEPLKLGDLPYYRAIWEASGSRLITVEERRAERLKREAQRPWNWVFGNKTEADFPLGYVKSAHLDEQTGMGGKE